MARNDSTVAGPPRTKGPAPCRLSSATFCGRRLPDVHLFHAFTPRPCLGERVSRKPRSAVTGSAAIAEYSEEPKRGAQQTPMLRQGSKQFPESRPSVLDAVPIAGAAYRNDAILVSNRASTVVVVGKPRTDFESSDLQWIRDNRWQSLTESRIFHTERNLSCPGPRPQ